MGTHTHTHTHSLDLTEVQCGCVIRGALSETNLRMVRWEECESVFVLTVWGCVERVSATEWLTVVVLCRVCECDGVAVL